MSSNHVPTAAVQVEMYRRMALMKANDERSRKVIMTGRLVMPYYSYRGQEVIPAAMSVNLTDDDYLVTIYRGIHDMIGKGMPLNDLWAEIAGRVDGNCKGKGGPMHLTYPTKGIMVTTGIVGSSMPIACGLAWGAQMDENRRVAVANFGDGASNIGAFHESLNLAAVWKLPVVFLCQNNLYGEHTKYEKATSAKRIADRAVAYDIPGVRVDGNNPLAMYEVAREAVERARAGEGPTLIEAMTFRFHGHVFGDADKYMDKAEKAAAMAADPVPAYRARLIAEGIATQDELAAIEAGHEAALDAAVEFALASRFPETSELTTDVFAMTKPVTIMQAINTALADAMADDDRVVVLGEDVADPEEGGVVGVTKGLSTRFGDKRVRSTPISEQAIIGAAIGASLVGWKPVAEIMLMNFTTVAMDMIVNHAAKLRFMSGGQTNVPIVIRTMTGTGFSSGGQHCDYLEAWFAHTAGIKVVAPSNATDAYGLMRAAIDDPDPVLFIENLPNYWLPGVPADAGHRVPIGTTRLVAAGSDITIVTYSRMANETLAAMEAITAAGVSAEVIDLRTVSPWDREAVLASVAKTGRCLIVHEAVTAFGPGAEIAAVVGHALFGRLKAPVERLGAPHAPVPFSKPLEDAFAPDAVHIAAAAIALARQG